MLDHIKALWKRLATLEPGQRFQTFHREQRNRSTAVKVAFFAAAFVCLAAGVIFALIPGPAVLFFALAGALLATQSLWLARWLDRGEVWARRMLASVRKSWRRRS